MISVFDLFVLSQIPNIGPNRLRSLVSHFDDTSNIVNASAKEISHIDGFSKKLASEIISFFKHDTFDEAKKYAEHQLSRLNKNEGSVVSFWEKQFPESLKRIDDPPVMLFMKGAFDELDCYAIAIVGTRVPSTYGTMMAEKFSEELSKIGITIVSGLARGIDTITHTTTLKTGGRTLAVIGSGIDVVYPPENKKLYERIPEQGAVVSEFPMGTKPNAENFPRRNRIISGLSLGTLVVETDINGGAMITAAMALNQNREVFAIPGNLDSKRSKGSNTLIKNGQAKLVESVDDILTELASKLKPILKKTDKVPVKPHVELTLFEQTVFNALDEKPLHIDSITQHAGVSTSDALVQLLSLEFKGLIRQLPGKMFIKI
ncbi:MAG: DNA-protecting protein DprA [Ignavibacteriales bacterium]|nr:DNA-protecting protein DprA [Ignavibacteriales bacterium]